MRYIRRNLNGTGRARRRRLLPAAAAAFLALVAALGVRPAGAVTAESVIITVEFPMLSGNDDAMANATQVDITSSGEYLHGKYSSTRSYDNYLRFDKVSLPSDADIIDARIVFTVRDRVANPSSVAIRGETGPGSAFTASASNFSSRVFTDSSVTSTAGPMAAGAFFTTENLAPVLSEMLAVNPSRESLVFKAVGLNPDSTLIMRSFNGSAAQSPKLRITYGSGSGTFTGTVAVADDDAEEYGAAKTISLSSNPQMGGYNASSLSASSKQVTGFRFNNVQIPANATVTGAWIVFTSDANGPSGRNANMVIRSELADSAAWTRTAGNVSSRRWSDSSVSWTRGSFVSARSEVRTPDISAIIDEARFCGWKSGQSLSFLIDGDNYIGTVYQGGSAYPPRLIVEYRAGGGGSGERFITDPSAITGVYINEVSTSGTASQDEDWIELYNSTDSFYVLGEGIRLWRDTSTKGDTFDFTGTLLAPHSYKVLIADGKTSAGSDHLSFDLKKTGEIFLTQQDPAKPKQVLRVIDSFLYSEQLYNETHARRPDGGNIILAVNDTYAAGNGAALEKYPLDFSRSRGLQPGPFTLTLNSKQGTAIRYTLDGTTPSSTKGTVYTGPVQISSTCAVRAVAYDAFGTSTPVTNTYVLQSNYPNEKRSGSQWQYLANITSAQYSEALAALPLVSITCDTVELSHSSSADYIQAYFEFVPAPGEPGGDFYSPIGVKRYGNVSRNQFNSSIAIRFKKTFGRGKAKYEFFSDIAGQPFGLNASYGKLELHEGQDGPQNDIYGLGYNRYDDTVTRKLANQSGLFDSHVRYAHYFYNGKYMGVKTMREDFGPQTFEVYFGADSNEFTKVTFEDGGFSTGRVLDGDGDSALWTKIRALATAKNFQEFKKYVDVDDMIRNQILFMFLDTENEINGVVQNSAPDGGVRMMFNVNDSDGAFHNDGAVTFSSRSLPGSGGTSSYKWGLTSSRQGAGGMFGAFSGDSTAATAGNLEFKTMVKDRVLEMIGPASGDFRGAAGAPLSADNVTKILTEEQAVLTVPYRLDAAYMGARTSMYSDWLNRNRAALSMVPDRVKANLQGWAKYNMVHTLSPVVIEDSAGGFTLKNFNTVSTTVYYTLDGTDPMGANGAAPGQAGANPSAKTYAGETIPSGSKVTVRAFTANNWGPMSVR